MTAPEFTEFLQLLYCQYPSLCEWLEQYSPDPTKTQQMWCHTLEPYTLAECKTVLEQWGQMFESPLKAYSRDMVASLIRATADRNRDLQRRANGDDQPSAEAQEYISRKGRTIHTNMTSTLDRILRWRRDVAAGQLDEADAQMFIRGALEEVK